jgi:hypothetical protein
MILQSFVVLFDCVDGKSLPTPAEKNRGGNRWRLLARTEKEKYNTLAKADNDNASQTSNTTKREHDMTSIAGH